MSAVAKHTLEPWQVRTDLDGKPKLDSRDGYTVERADPTAGKPFVVSTWSLSHAHLIAAAPDVLEALRDCLNRFIEAFPASSEYEPIKRGFAAIAKAEGRS